jgi:hypothetical protein
VLVQTGTYIASADDVKRWWWACPAASRLRWPTWPGWWTARPAVALCLARAGQGFGRREAAGERFPAVTLSISKKPGENAADVADGVIRRMEALKGRCPRASR